MTLISSRKSSLSPRSLLGLILFCLSCQTPPPLDPKACKNIVVLPPESIDERTSDYVIKTWTREARRRKILRSCDRVVDSLRAKNTFKFMNITNLDPVQAGRLSLKQRNTLQTDLSATHVLSLDYDYTYKSKSLRLKPLIYELRSNQRDDSSRILLQFSVADASEGYFEIPVSRWAKLTLVNLTPTTVTLGFSNAEFINDYNQDGPDPRYQEISSARQGSLPPILSGIRFENILHRNGYNLFDYSLRFVPYWNVTVVNNKYTYAPLQDYLAAQENPARTFEIVNYDLRFYAGTANLLLDFSFYNPLGTFFFSLGAGLVTYHYQDSLSTKTSGLAPSFLFRTGYRIFLLDRWLAQLIVEGQTYNDIVESTYFKSANESYVLLGIGYFYPELQSKLRAAILDE